MCRTKGTHCFSSREIDNYINLTRDLYHEGCISVTDVIHYSDIDTVLSRITKCMIHYQTARAFVFHGGTTVLYVKLIAMS